MSYSGKLTIEQKDKLVGVYCYDNVFFQPVENESLDWIISEEEMIKSSYPENDWVKTLPLIPYVPKGNIA